MLQEDGTLIERARGTPQGGVVSPVLANLFLHYTFDLWMARTFPHLRWCRYADDGLVHCRTEREARAIWEALTSRRLELIQRRRRSSTAETIGEKANTGAVFAINGLASLASASRASPRPSATKV
jgi:retron-type reverse transcriptase